MKRISFVTITLLGVAVCAALALLAYSLWVKASPESPLPTAQSPAEITYADRTVTSVKGVKMILHNWPSDNILPHTYTLRGEVPGSWANEGEFIIDTVFEGDIGYPLGTATVDGDWMTDDMVPFAATLDFGDKFVVGDEVSFLIHNANPSGLPDNDDSVRLTVTLADEMP